jgi:small subunit ribosomal protein S25
MTATGIMRSIKVDKKWSTTILREVMDAAGGDPWQEYKQQQIKEGLPLLPGEDKAARIEAQWKRQTATPNESQETDS